MTVSTAAQLDAAIKTAKARDTIRLAPGNYGAFEFKDINPASAITIVAANPASLPVFTNLKVTGSSNLKLSRLVVTAPAPTEANPFPYAATVLRSSDIRLSDMVFHGVLGGGVKSEPRGLRLSKSTGITVTRNSFTELSHALMTDGSTQMTITDNGFTGIRTDGIMTDGASGSTIARNRFSEFRPEPGDHVDAIQLFNKGNATVGLTVTDNLMIGGASGQMQGVFMTNGSGDPAQLDQIVVTKNLMWGTMYNGIAAFTADHVSVTGNRLYSNALLDASKTWVRLEDVATATATNNYAGAYLYDDIGTLINSGNVLSLLDVRAQRAITLWDASHVAASLSLPYDDPENSRNGGTSFAPSGLASVRRTANFIEPAALFNASALGAVPEPVSWAMMIAGFGLIGTMRRRLQHRARRRIQRA